MHRRLRRSLRLQRMLELAAAGPRGRDEQTMSAAAIAVLIAVALVALLHGQPSATGHGVASPPTPPGPSISPGRSATYPPTSRPGKPIACRRPSGSKLGGQQPTRVCVPAIGVDAKVMQLGLNSDRTVQVPPLSEVRNAGWYKYSALPGANGPSVILGHVDSAQYGTGVFYRLGQLHKNDQIQVVRADSTEATYRVTSVAEVSKRHFPTRAVYGPTKTRTIRLVTCGGRFDAATGNYVDNIIVYGSLMSGSLS